MSRIVKWTGRRARCRFVLASVTADLAAAEPEGRRQGPRVLAPGVRRQDVHARPTSRARRPSSSPGSPRRSPAAAPRSASRSREQGEALKGLNVAYFTASVDDARATTRSSPSRSNCDYPILSDPDKSVAKAYGVVHEGRAGARALDLLHRQGRHHPRDRQEGQHRERRRPTSPRS